MLTSITPLGEQGKQQRWGVTATAYVLGSVLGGAALGLAAGALGSLTVDALADAALLAAAAAVCAVAALSDAPSPRWRLPGGRRQVDEDWLTRYRGWVYGLGFGLQLGLGIVTIVTSAATYAFVALALLSASPWLGLSVGATFGLLRALPILLVRKVHDPSALRTLAVRVEASADWGRRTAVLVLALGALVLGTGAVAA